MNKSLVIQAGLITIILIIGYFTYSYLNRSSIKDLTKESQSNQIQSSYENNARTQDQSNTILDLSYRSSDEKGNIYEIDSISGTIDSRNKNILFLKTVTAKISIFNYGTFSIKSNNARYDKLTLDTHFYGAVNLLYLDHIIKSEDLFLKYIDKEIKITNNVIYNSNNSLLRADEIQLDLFGKKSKIFMKEKNKKVKITLKN